MKDNHFWNQLRKYFSIYLPRQRNSSKRTIEACHMAWNLFLRFIIHNKDIKAAQINFETFTSPLLTEFLDAMEEEKKWKTSTRNHRLSCIRSFFKYAAYSEPEIYPVYADLCSIPLKKEVDNTHMVSYMSRKAVATLIACADSTERKGLRDQFFMTLMYDTAARDGEMLGLRLMDLDEKNATIYLMGKGSKPRIVPVSKETIVMFDRYKAIFHFDKNKESPMFYTMHRREKTPMSDDNVARFIKKYAIQAREKEVQVPENVHPHMLRHSRAMHLYQGGMPLSILSEFLGHTTPETTLIYAHADTEMKREAIEKASSQSVSYLGKDDLPVWNDPDIISQLLRGY